MPTEPFIKVCGVREPTVASAAIRAGATAIGLNFVPGSRRSVSLDEARGLLETMRGQFEALPIIVGIFVDAAVDWVNELRAELALDLVQLHGHESPTTVVALAPAIKAVRIGSRDDLDALDRFPGDLVVVDARVRGKLGGTGQRIPLDLAREAAQRRAIVLAGGLDAKNVGRIIRDVQPAGVDTASGAEDANGSPSAEATSRFVDAAKRAFGAINSSRSNE